MRARDQRRAWRPLAALATLSLAGMSLASPALADGAPSTRLVRCGTDNCLLVTGHRDSANAPVLINGHAVTVEGNRNWRVRLPIATVRDWSAPFARKIEVSTSDALTSDDAVQHAKLPIGLLGHVPDLASLIITLN